MITTTKETPHNSDLRITRYILQLKEELIMKKRMIAIALTLLMASAVLAGCSSSETTEKNGKNTNNNAEPVTLNQSATTAASVTTESDPDAAFTGGYANGMIDASDLFSSRDMEQEADVSEAKTLTLSDGKDVTITEAGVYIISGSATDATIVVEAEDDAKVQLVLDNVTITNSSAPAVYVKNADKVFITTASGSENSMTVSGSFTADGDTNTDAVIFSKEDLVLNGLGTLTINSSDNGVSGKDDIKITGGIINITSASDAVEANDSIVAAGGSVTISSGKDGLHAENDDDNTSGYIYIGAGSFDITAASDGIQATTVLQIDNGTVTTNSSEGLEATYIQINGGVVNINASDDGVNASNKSGAYSVTAEFNGGEINIDMGQGDTDAIDSNGDLYINGGVLNINAQSPFDYDGSCEYNGGTIYVNGELTTEITNQFGGMGGGPGGRGGMGGPGGMM